MGDMLNLEGRWPELFEGLTYIQRESILEAFAAAWHEGWEPNYADVKRMTDEARGLINEEEFLRSAREDARDRAAARRAIRP